MATTPNFMNMGHDKGKTTDFQRGFDTVGYGDATRRDFNVRSTLKLQEDGAEIVSGLGDSLTMGGTTQMFK